MSSSNQSSIRGFNYSAAAILLTLALAGCSGPLMMFPGGALEGPEQPLNLNALSAEGGALQLETNPADPYSVNLGYVVVKGNMYVDPAESRAWYQHIKTNPAVRLRMDGAETVYLATAVTESDPTVLEKFEADRIVLRLIPR